MTVGEYRTYCLSFKGTTEDFPFDESTLVFRVRGKIFVLTDVDLFESVNTEEESKTTRDWLSDYAEDNSSRACG